MDINEITYQTRGDRRGITLICDFIVALDDRIGFTLICDFIVALDDRIGYRR
jgi:hypothetical protein